MPHAMLRGVATVAASVAAVATVMIGVMTPMPPGTAPLPPTDAEVRALAAQVISNTWESTGLPGESPMVELGDVERMPAGSSFDALSGCMADSGHPLNQYSFSENEGYQAVDSSGSPIDDPALQRVWFDCVVQHPLDSDLSTFTLSPSEKAWTIDRQRQWTAPCVLLHGAGVPEFPSDSDPWAFYWSAYQEVWMTSSPAEAQRIEADCGHAELTPEAGADTSVSGYLFRNTGG